MKGRLKLAILEDNRILLNELVGYIEDYQLGEIIFTATRSEDFFKQFELARQKPEALILDIELAGESIDGIGVASLLNLPTLFVSGKAKDFDAEIGELDLQKEVPIMTLRKPISAERLIRIFNKFEISLKAFQKPKSIFLPIIGYDKEHEIQLSDIIFIRSISAYESKSNNKEIQLTSIEKPLMISHKPMSYFFEKGLPKDQFIEINQSCIVRRALINQHEIKRNDKSHTITFEVKGKVRQETFAITDRYWINRKL